jgi:ribosomal protein S18 acetylase RimI-like enzyme
MLRSASPADLELLVWAVAEAGRSHLVRGLWDLLIPGAPIMQAEIIHDLIMGPRTNAAYLGHFWVADLDGSPSAAISAFDSSEVSEEENGAALVDALVSAGWSEEALEALIARCRPMMTLGYPTPEGVWILDNAATRRRARGRGLMRALVERALEHGAARGLRTAQLAVRIGNLRARRVYERAGFRVVSTHQSPEFKAAFGCPGLWCMQRAL